MSEPSRRYRILVTRRAEKDIAKLGPKLRRKLKEILVNRIVMEPYSGKKLMGELDGYWSVRLSYRDRILDRIDEAERIVYLIRARTHYGS